MPRSEDDWKAERDDWNFEVQHGHRPDEPCRAGCPVAPYYHLPSDWQRHLTDLPVVRRAA